MAISESAGIDQHWCCLAAQGVDNYMEMRINKSVIFVLFFPSAVHLEADCFAVPAAGCESYFCSMLYVSIYT
jgi:hypothetical protein